MSDTSVFNEGVDFLLEAEKVVLDRDYMKQKLDEKKSQQKKLKKAVASEEKSIQDEINSTLKKRKATIESSYDKQLDENRGKTKSIQNKRNRNKEKQMNQRVEDATADLKEENRQLAMEMKTLFKKEHVPAICNTTLYYSLFLTKGVKEIVIFILSFLFALAGIPSIIYFVLKFTAFKATGVVPTWLAIIIYALIIILVFALYFVLVNTTKIRHRDALLDGRAIRDKIRANSKNIKAVKNSIAKDKDESSYDLDKFDSRLDELARSSEQISRDKQDAMTIFENETKNEIIDEINSRRLDKLEDMKAELAELDEMVEVGSEALAEQNLAITNQYEAYLGKAYCKPAALRNLISLMQEGSASTVGEAISIYKGKDKDSQRVVEEEA